MSIRTNFQQDVEKKNDPTKWPEVKWADIYNYLIEMFLFVLYHLEEMLVSELLAKIIQSTPSV